MRKILVIFDCDGVLVDSEPLASRILGRTARELGLDMSDFEAKELFTGCSMNMVIGIFNNLLSVPLKRDFSETFIRDLHKCMRNELKPITDIKSTITKIKNLKYVGGLCVASNGDAETVKMSLEVTGLKGLFKNNIFSAQEVKCGKPSPDLFLYAARQMGFSPEHCVVIEDSDRGIAAGVAAGMHVFQYKPNLEQNKSLNENHNGDLPILFRSMENLPKLLDLSHTRYSLKKRPGY